MLRNKDGSISLKLADFGLAMEVHQAIFTVCGTPTYVAPEILSETGMLLDCRSWHNIHAHVHVGVHVVIVAVHVRIRVVAIAPNV